MRCLIPMETHERELSLRSTFSYALHGVAPDPGTTRAAYEETLRWVQSASLPLPRLAVRGEGYRGGAINFNAANRLLRSADWSKIFSVELFGVREATEYITDGCDYLVCLSVRDGRGEFVMCVVEPALSSLVGELRQACHTLSGILNPSYGYRRQLRYGPLFYAWGTIYGGGLHKDADRQIEAEKISNWANFNRAEQLYLHGLLRDVYPWNLLTAPQLDADVLGQPLRAWVAADPAARGTLSPYTGDLWM